MPYKDQAQIFLEFEKGPQQSYFPKPLKANILTIADCITTPW